MSDERDPWTRRWQPYVEGLEFLGGDDADFLDIEKSVVGAPRTDEVNILELEHALAATPQVAGEVDSNQSASILINCATIGVLANMSERGIAEAEILLADFEVVTESYDQIASPDIGILQYIYESEASQASEPKDAEDFQELADLAFMAAQLTASRLMIFNRDSLESIAEILEEAEHYLASFTMSDSTRNAFQQIIDELKQS